MRPLAALLLTLASCGASWRPANLDEIKSEVWRSISTEPEDWRDLKIYFVAMPEIPKYCEGWRGGCYWHETGKLYAPAEPAEHCGQTLAHELRHYVLHMTLGNPDPHHTLLPVWSGDWTRHACE